MKDNHFLRFGRRVIEEPFNLRSAGLGRLLMFAVLLACGQAGLAQVQHGLPFVNAAGAAQTGFVWIVNRSASAGTVKIGAVDDSGTRFGPVDLSLGAMAGVRLNSSELEGGNAVKGLPVGIGNGEGDWRLELTTELDIEPLAFIRTRDGFVTAGHDIVQPEYVPASGPGGDDSILYYVSFFNPGSNPEQQSRLRLINTSNTEVVVTIGGVDDAGQPPPGGEVSVTLGAYEAHTITAQELEQGDTDFEGSFGDGTGKWRLSVSAVASTHGETRPIQVVNLLFGSITGNLANISSLGPGNDPNRGGDGVDYITGGGGDDILNPGSNDDRYDVVFGSAGNDRIVYSDSGATAYQALNYRDLGTGISATIDGATNTASVTKGSLGTDTIVDVANPLNASKERPYGGFQIVGSGHDDTFVLTAPDQWMDVRGEAGNDRIDIRSGNVSVNFRTSTQGIDVDLASGRVSNDGFGGVDTIIGNVFRVRGGLGDDTLRGSDGVDRLDGGPGDDVLNPGDNECSDDEIRGSTGDDRIVYTDSGANAWQGLTYDRLSTGGITATIDGTANRATVDKGAAGTDTIVDIANALDDNCGFGLYGSRFDDIFHVTRSPGQWMLVRGGAGNDTFNGNASRIDYSGAPSGIDVDLGAGKAYDDGFGGVDTINDGPYGIRGTDFKDVIRGSDNGESFIGRQGDDIIDGRGGYDVLRFDRRNCCLGLFVDLNDGGAVGIWSGVFFSYTISGIEHVRGSNNDDNLVGSNGNDTLDGRRGDDTINGLGGDDQLYGGGGDDIFFFDRGDGDDLIHDFADGDDILVLTKFGITSKDQVLNNASAWSEGTGVHIDLTSFGGGTIGLVGFHRDNFDASDFLI